MNPYLNASLIAVLFMGGLQTMNLSPSDVIPSPSSSVESTASAQSNQSADVIVDELNAFWKEASRTVADGDFEGYAATYHPDAVLVNESSNTRYPIATALAGWKSGFDDTKAGKMKAGVEFRFTKRMHDATTAHETGIFYYVSTPKGGKPTGYRVHFQGLLVKKDGAWKLVMEYQQNEASMEEWNAAGRKD